MNYFTHCEVIGDSKVSSPDRQVLMLIERQIFNVVLLGSCKIVSGANSRRTNGAGKMVLVPRAIPISDPIPRP